MKKIGYCILIFFTIFCHTGYGQNEFPENGDVIIKKSGATLYIVNDGLGQWTRAGLELRNHFQSIPTYFQIYYEKDEEGNTGSSNAIFRKSNSLGFLNYMHFDDSSNSINFMSNKSGSQTYGNLRVLNGNLLLGSTSKLGIGTNNPSERLEVNGTIRAKEVKLEATNWPDYVFSESYHLRSLEETDVYIQTHGHLPGLKSAAEYQKDGVNMMELNQKLLEKIEELTLYIIQQHQNTNIQKTEMENMKSEIEFLKQYIKP